MLGKDIMKLNVLYVILFLGLVFSCEKDKSIIESSPSGSFTYQSFDTLGNLLVSGWLAFEFTDSVKIEGSWHLYNLSNRNDIGPQVGDGILIGSIIDSSISIDLNPPYIDHNVYLAGTINDNFIEGKWIWATYAGASNRGTFKAIKN